MNTQPRLSLVGRGGPIRENHGNIDPRTIVVAILYRSMTALLHVTTRAVVLLMSTRLRKINNASTHGAEKSMIRSAPGFYHIGMALPPWCLLSLLLQEVQRPPPPFKVPQRETFRNEGLYDPLSRTQEMFDLALQKTWPQIFTPLEMVTRPPGLFTPAKLELVGAPSRHSTESTLGEVKDEIIQRVEWRHDNLSRWAQTCTRYHHLLQESDRYFDEIRRRIVEDGVYISSQE